MKTYLESELPQGSQAWLDMRKTMITATMATVIIGTSPFQKPYKLWQELLGLIPPVSVNPAMLRGQKLEPVARRLYETKTGEKFAPMCVINEALLDNQGQPWIFASLDGADAFFQQGVEIKCPGRKTHDLALSGDIPLHYQDQMLWQMLATENRMKVMQYVSYNPDYPVGAQISIVPFHLDVARQQDLLRAAEIFRDCVRNEIPPGGTEFEQAAKMFVIANKEADAADQRLKEAKELLLKVTDGKATSGCGVIVSVSERKGAVDTEAVNGVLACEFGIPLDKLDPTKLLAAVLEEFGVPKDRLAEITVQHTALPKQVVSIKAANDAQKVYEAALSEQAKALVQKESVISGDNAVEVASVAPTW